MDDTTAAAFTDTSPISEAHLMNTVTALPSSRILWFSGSDDSLLGHYQYQQERPFVLLWPIHNNDQPAVLASSLANFARGRSLRDEAWQSGSAQLGRLRKPQKKPISEWLHRVTGGEGERDEGDDDEGRKQTRATAVWKSLAGLVSLVCGACGATS